MSVKENKVAYGVRVKLNENFQIKCLGDEYLKDEPVLFISYGGISQDERGEWVFINGGSLTNSGRVYLDEIDLVHDVPERPLYTLYDFDANPNLGEGEKCPPTQYNEGLEKGLDELPHGHILRCIEVELRDEKTKTIELKVDETQPNKIEIWVNGSIYTGRHLFK